MLHLKTRNQFQAVLAGSKLASTAHFVVHYLAPEQWILASDTRAARSNLRKPLFSHSDVWLGPLIPKRLAKRAVTRNAIKRQIFNVVRDFESVLPLGAYVVRLRTEFVRKQFPSASSESLKQAVRVELGHLLSKLPGANSRTPQHGRAT